MLLFKSILNKSISVVFRVLLAIILIAIFVANLIPYNDYFKRNLGLSNFFLMLLGIIFLSFLYWCIDHCSFHVSKAKSVVIFAVLFIVQVIISFCAMYETGWDAETVTGDAYNLAMGNTIDPGYYSHYTNNMLGMVFYSKLFSGGVKLGLSNFVKASGACVLFNCCIYFYAGLLLADCIYRLTCNKKASIFGFLICYVFICISPWNFVLYTDSLGIIFPIFTLWVYLTFKENTLRGTVLKWIALLFISTIGFYIKAESLIMLIAIVIAHSIHVFIDSEASAMIYKLVPIVLTLVLVIPAFRLSSNSVVKIFEKETGVEYDQEKSFSMLHWLMIGMNVESDGTFNGEDDTFSHYITDRNERVSQNKKVIKERLKEMGPKGFCELMIHKLILNYNDGSFGNGLDGEGFIVDSFSEDTAVNSWIRFFYRPDRQGFYAYLIFAQMLWLGILFFSLFMRNSMNSQPIMLSIIGLTAFVMLFEAQPRYLVVFAPIYVITGVLGICEFMNIVREYSLFIKVKRFLIKGN
ncbi:MAG: hypothetical protein J5504_04775 [Butyrivibrio sp.]|nr:hypothetical protein [Butyrivibrio sp.]